jgi:bleomycin hydrolase
MSTSRSRKRKRKNTDSKDKDDDLLTGLSLDKGGEYIKVDEKLLKRLKQTQESELEKPKVLSDADIMKILKDLFSDCPEYADIIKDGKPITTDTINQANKKLGPEQRRMAEMTANIPVDWLALKRSVTKEQNFEYRFKPPIQPRVTDQFHSGRCWLFASLNVLRYEFIHRLNLDHKFEFSASYLYFWDKIERANVFLESVWALRDKPLDDRYLDMLINPVSHPINDGGYWQYFKNLVCKYGLVPKKVYGDSYNCLVSDYMNEVLISILNQFALEILKLPDKTSRKKFNSLKTKWNEKIYDLIVRFMGEPPKKFDWVYKDATGQYGEMKNLTPEKFFKVIVPHSFATKMTFVHDPRHPEWYYRPYVLEHGLNVIGGDPVTFINLPLDVFKKAVATSQINSEPVWFGCDVSASLDHETKTMDTERFDYEAVLGVETRYNKADMMWMKNTAPTHAMVINGVDMEDPDMTDEGEFKYKKWRVENSWGIDTEMEWAEDEGCWQMSDDWFDKYVYMAVVDLRYFDEDALKKIMDNKDKKVPIKPWDVFGSVALMAGCKHCKYTVPIKKKILKH